MVSLGIDILRYVTDRVRQRVAGKHQHRVPRRKQRRARDTEERCAHVAPVDRELVVLPAHPDVDGQFVCRADVVLEERGMEATRVLIHSVLDAAARRAGISKQEVRHSEAAVQVGVEELTVGRERRLVPEGLVGVQVHAGRDGVFAYCQTDGA